MGVIRHEVREIVVDMICEECGKGRMRPTKTILREYPPKYIHECNKCGAMDIYTVRYPYVEFPD